MSNRRRVDRNQFVRFLQQRRERVGMGEMVCGDQPQPIESFSALTKDKAAFARELPPRVRSFCFLGVGADGCTSPKKLARELTRHAGYARKLAAKADYVRSKEERALTEIARLITHSSGRYKIPATSS
jgi:hypothetical protein